MSTAVMESPTNTAEKVGEEYFRLIARKAELAASKQTGGPDGGTVLDNHSEQFIRRFGELLRRSWRADVEVATALIVHKTTVASSLPDSDPSPAALKKLRAAVEAARHRRRLAEVEFDVFRPCADIRRKSELRHSLLNAAESTERLRADADTAASLRKLAGVARNKLAEAEAAVRRAEAVPAMRELVNNHPEIAAACGF
jgi:hypothetical protein